MGCDGSDGGAAAAWTVAVVCVGAGGDVTGAAGGAGAGAGLGCGFGLGGEGCGGDDCGAGAGRTGATATGCDAARVEAGATLCRPARRATRWATALCGATRLGGIRTTFGAGAGWTTRGVAATRTSGVLDSKAARQRYPEVAPAATRAQSRSASNEIRTRIIIGPVDDSIGADLRFR